MSGTPKRRPLKPRRTRLVNRTRIARRVRPKPVNRKKKAATLQRAYGPPERRAWIRGLPCICCGKGPSDNSHVRSRSGAGRKGDARFVVPMCRPDHRLYDHPSKFLAKYPQLTDAALTEMAGVVARAWDYEKGLRF